MYATLYLDYVEDVYQTMLHSINGNKLKETVQELKDMTPASMNTMLEKEPKQQAIEKQQRRKTMTVLDVPPTTPGKYIITAN